MSQFSCDNDRDVVFDDLHFFLEQIHVTAEYSTFQFVSDNYVIIG